MALFVINEWLWSDVSGTNGVPAQRDAVRVIEGLATSAHQIVLVQGSPFDQKAWSLCKSNNPMLVQRIAGAYVANLRQNSDRCLILSPETLLPLPKEIASATKADDHYLIQAQRGVEGAILITTDGDLCQAVRGAGLPCISRNEFLATYF